MISTPAYTGNLEFQNPVSLSKTDLSVLRIPLREDSEPDVASRLIFRCDKQATLELGKTGELPAMSDRLGQDIEVTREFRAIMRKFAGAYRTATVEFEEPQINATSTYDILPQLVAEIRDIFIAAGDEYFEDGVETDFSRSVIQLVEQYRDDAIKALQSMISRDLLAPKLVAEALCWLGQVEEPASHIKRRELLQENLGHRSPYIRDGAMVGLAYLEDPRSLEALRVALQREPIAELREYIEETIEQLEHTQSEDS